MGRDGVIDKRGVCRLHADAAVGHGSAQRAVIIRAVVIEQIGMEGHAAVEQGNIGHYVAAEIPRPGFAVDVINALRRGRIGRTAGAGEGFQNRPVSLGAGVDDDLLRITADPDQIICLAAVASEVDEAAFCALGVVIVRRSSCCPHR